MGRSLSPRHLQGTAGSHSALCILRRGGPQARRGSIVAAHSLEPMGSSRCASSGRRPSRGLGSPREEVSSRHRVQHEDRCLFLV